MCWWSCQSSLQHNCWRQRQVSLWQLMWPTYSPAPFCVFSTEAPVYCQCLRKTEIFWISFLVWALPAVCFLCVRQTDLCCKDLASVHPWSVKAFTFAPRAWASCVRLWMWRVNVRVAPLPSQLSNAVNVSRVNIHFKSHLPFLTMKINTTSSPPFFSYSSTSSSSPSSTSCFCSYYLSYLSVFLFVFFTIGLTIV